MLNKWNLFLCWDKILLWDTWELKLWTSETGSCVFSDSRKKLLQECPLSCGVMEAQNCGGREGCFVFCLCFTQLESRFEVEIWAYDLFLSATWNESHREEKTRHKILIWLKWKSAKAECSLAFGSSGPLSRGGWLCPCNRLGLVPAVDSVYNICWIWGGRGGGIF